MTLRTGFANYYTFYGRRVVGIYCQDHCTGEVHVSTGLQWNHRATFDVEVVKAHSHTVQLMPTQSFFEFHYPRQIAVILSQVGEQWLRVHDDGVVVILRECIALS